MEEIAHEENHYPRTRHTINWGLVTGAIFFDDRRSKKNGLFPLKIRITYKRERLYINTGYALSKEDWKERFDSSAQKIRAARIAILKQYELIGNAIEDMNSKGEFSFALLNRHLGRGKRDDIFSQFEGYISDLKKNGQLGTAITYSCALNSIKTHTGSKSLSFDRINDAWLESYEKYMVKEGNRTATRSIYFRCLRAMINKAGKPNPFGRDKFVIKNGEGRHMALTRDEIIKLMKHEVLSGSTTEKMRDLFYFSYLTNGINIKDLISLTWKDNIQNNEIVFLRAKTARTNATERIIRAPILKPMQAILDKWSDQNSKFIFGYINENMTAEQRKLICSNLVRLMNKHLKDLSKTIGLPRISTYSARHAYASNLLRNEAPIAYISEQLGHSNIMTTQSYLAGFDAEMRRKMNETLTGE